MKLGRGLVPKNVRKRLSRKMTRPRDVSRATPGCGRRTPPQAQRFVGE